MWKLLTSLSVWVVILGTHVAQANMVSCAHVAPYGLPQIELSNSQVICRRGYVLQHDNQARIPVWVSYTLSRAQTLACAPRPDRFEPEPLLRPSQRSDMTDYRRSGYDQGHMAPNADLSWDPQVQRESFYLSNIAPQLPGLNRGLWRELEAIVRAWAYERGSLTIYVGPIYNRQSPHTIGANRVVVPVAFFKIVIDNQTSTHLAFYFPHVDNLPDHVRYAQTTVARIQAETGVQFPVPGNVHTQSSLWNIATRPYVIARQKSCTGN